MSRYGLDPDPELGKTAVALGPSYSPVNAKETDEACRHAR